MLQPTLSRRHLLRPSSIVPALAYAAAATDNGGANWRRVRRGIAVDLAPRVARRGRAAWSSGGVFRLLALPSHGELVSW